MSLESSASRISKGLERTTLDAAQVEKFVLDRLSSMPTEHLLELRKGIELARDALSGDHGAEIMIERALKAGSLFLTGGAIAAGLYQLIPLLLVPAFPEIMPGLKAPTQARDEKLAITNNIHAELKAEFERRSVISTNVETSPPPQHFSVPE